MADSRRGYRIGEIGRVVTGRTPPGTHPDYFGDCMPFLTPTDMDGRRTVETTGRSLSPKGVDHLKQVVVPHGIAVSCIGWQMGKALLIDRPVITNQQINSIIPDRTRVDDLFLYYTLAQRRNEIFALGAGGSRTPILNKSGFENIIIDLPPLSEQRVIAHILGTLDDKIELNRQMNETLEAMARALFKSWFVDATEDGLPKGWCNGTVSDLATISRDGLNPGEFLDETFDHYSIPAFDAGRTPKPETGDIIKSNKFIVPPGCVMVSKLNPRIPRVWLPDARGENRAVCSTEFLVTTPKPSVSREYLFCLFSNEAFVSVFGTMVTGTSGSHQRVKPESLLGMDAVIPPPPVMQSFTDATQPLLERINHNIAEARTLAALRDALLPKLISGELRVRDTECTVEATL